MTIFCGLSVRMSTCSGSITRRVCSTAMRVSSWAAPPSMATTVSGTLRGRWRAGAKFGEGVFRSFLSAFKDAPQCASWRYDRCVWSLSPQHQEMLLQEPPNVNAVVGPHPLSRRQQPAESVEHEKPAARLQRGLYPCDVLVQAQAMLEHPDGEREIRAHPETQQLIKGRRVADQEPLRFDVLCRQRRHSRADVDAQNRPILALDQRLCEPARPAAEIQCCRVARRKVGVDDLHQVLGLDSPELLRRAHAIRVERHPSRLLHRADVKDRRVVVKPSRLAHFGASICRQMASIASSIT